MWGNTIVIHSVLKKKTTKLNSQPAQYEKKNRQRQFWKQNHKKMKKKTMWGNTIAIHNIFKEKKINNNNFEKKNTKKRRRQFWKKKWKKNMRGKLKLNSQPVQY
jgi:hypothetical protein